MSKREKNVKAEEAEIGECAERACRASLHGRLAFVARRLAGRQQEVLIGHGLDLRSYATLARLEHAPSSTQLDLAKQSRVDKSSLVAILDGLEKEGWVERIADPRDRRARIVQATEAGKRRLARAHECVRAVEDELLETLPTNARTSFLDALAALSEGPE